MFQVREGGGSQSPIIEQLLAATKAAETQKKGIWAQVHQALLLFCNMLRLQTSV